MDRKLWLGFYVHGKSGACFHPTHLKLWKDEDFKNHPPEKPFYYNTDALAGLSLVHLHSHMKNPFSSPKMNFSFCSDAWRAMEPHHELFDKSQARVHSLRTNLKTDEGGKQITQFEHEFTGALEAAVSRDSFDLNELHSIVDSIDKLEDSLTKPLLFNFSLRLSRETLSKMHHLHSLLFHLRGLIALDYNAHIVDASHEAIKVDSITDYIPRADYVANDAVLYYKLHRHAPNIPTLTFEEMKKSFFQYAHNGACLIENLPKAFLNSMPKSNLEESLYLVQMDWLLGTEAGLLYRIREELFGLKEGYEQIFWPEIAEKTPTPHSPLAVAFELTDEDVYPGLKGAA